VISLLISLNNLGLKIVKNEPSSFEVRKLSKKEPSSMRNKITTQCVCYWISKESLLRDYQGVCRDDGGTKSPKVQVCVFFYFLSASWFRVLITTRSSPIFNSSSFALKIHCCLDRAVFFVLRKFRLYRITIDEDIERIKRRWISLFFLFLNPKP